MDLISGGLFDGFADNYFIQHPVESGGLFDVVVDDYFIQDHHVEMKSGDMELDVNLSMELDANSMFVFDVCGAAENGACLDMKICDMVAPITLEANSIFKFDKRAVSLEMKDSCIGISMPINAYSVFKFDDVVATKDENEMKTEFCKTARRLRSLAQRHFDYGTAGTFGGVDGEFSASVMFRIIQRMLTKAKFRDLRRYGVDLGSGSGMALFAFFNFGAKLPMVGIELNEMRYLYSIRLQELLSESSEFNRKLSKMSLLFHGNAIDVLKSELSSRPSYLWIVYWFREGWSTDDIEAVVRYLNNLPNLEWIIVDLSYAQLTRFGYIGSLRSESVSFKGPLNKSSNARTLHLHHVCQAPAYYDTSSCYHSAAIERSLLSSFSTECPIKHAKAEIERIEGIYSARMRSCKNNVKKTVN